MSAEDKFQKAHNYRYNDKNYVLAEVWYKKAAEEGYATCVAEGADAAIKFFQWYLDYPLGDAEQ